MVRLILHKIKLLALVLPPSLALLFPGVSLAGGPIWGAKAAAMGTAFLAVADDPSM